MPMEAAVPSAFSVTPCVNWELTGITSNQLPTNSLSSFCVAVWHEANKPAATASIIVFFMIYIFLYRLIVSSYFSCSTKLMDVPSPVSVRVTCFPFPLMSASGFR